MNCFISTKLAGDIGKNEWNLKEGYGRRLRDGSKGSCFVSHPRPSLLFSPPVALSPSLRIPPVTTRRLPCFLADLFLPPPSLPPTSLYPPLSSPYMHHLVLARF